MPPPPPGLYVDLQLNVNGEFPFVGHFSTANLYKRLPLPLPTNLPVMMPTATRLAKRLEEANESLQCIRRPKNGGKSAYMNLSRI